MLGLVTFPIVVIALCKGKHTRRRQTTKDKTLDGSDVGTAIANAMIARGIVPASTHAMRMIALSVLARVQRGEKLSDTINAELRRGLAEGYIVHVMHGMRQ
jgi:hypothetical protein